MGHEIPESQLYDEFERYIDTIATWDTTLRRWLVAGRPLSYQDLKRIRQEVLNLAADDVKSGTAPDATVRMGWDRSPTRQLLWADSSGAA